MALLLGITLLLLGLLFFLLAGHRVWQGVGVRRWPVSQGRVRAVALDECLQGDEGDRYWPRVTYEYEVDSRWYHGDRISFGATAMGLTEAQRTIEHYARGTAVTVFYDPENPATAVLEPRTSWQDVELFGALGLGCWTGALLVSVTD